LVTAGWDLRHQIHGQADAVPRRGQGEPGDEFGMLYRHPDELGQPRETEQDDQLNSNFQAEIR
jgi:hypothetical protein